KKKKADGRLTVRMYRQGLGDCFLLGFPGGGHMVIDCGTIGAQPPSVAMDAVLADIRKSTGDELDAVVATHEHDDHVSGFRTHLDDWKAITVAESWQAWTENAEDKQARDLEKYAGDLFHATAAAAALLGGLGDPAMAALGAAAREILSFNGVGVAGGAQAAEKKADGPITHAAQIGAQGGR